MSSRSTQAAVVLGRGEPSALLSASAGGAATEPLVARLQAMREGTCPRPEARMAEAFASDYRTAQGEEVRG